MQVDCYRRNWRTQVCVPKCPFYCECNREFLLWKLKKPVVVEIEGKEYRLCPVV